MDPPISKSPEMENKPSLMIKNPLPKSVIKPSEPILTPKPRSSTPPTNNSPSQTPTSLSTSRIEPKSEVTGSITAPATMEAKIEALKQWTSNILTTTIKTKFGELKAKLSESTTIPEILEIAGILKSFKEVRFFNLKI